MDRVYQSHAIETPPAAVASSGSYPTSGNKTTGQSATVPGPYWFYSITEEIRNAIVAAGLVPDPAKVNQLALAMAAFLPKNGGDISGNLTIQGATLVRSVNGTLPNSSGALTLTKDDITDSLGYVPLKSAPVTSVDGKTGAVTTGAVTQRSTKTATGTWTITGLTIGKPLFITFKGSTENKSYAFFTITSGTDAGGSTEFALGNNAGSGWLSAPGTVIIPTATSVTLNVTSFINGTALYAHQ